MNLHRGYNESYVDHRRNVPQSVPSQSSTPPPGPPVDGRVPMRHRNNINGFNCPSYNRKPNAMMTVRLPEEHLVLRSLNDTDLLHMMRKRLLLTHKEVARQKNNGHDGYDENALDIYQWITYNEVHQFLTDEFPSEYRQIAEWLNGALFDEEREGYVQRRGRIGSKECQIRYEICVGICIGFCCLITFRSF